VAARDSSRGDTSRHQEKRDADGRSSDRDRKTRESAEATDDDERDRRKMGEIMRQMEERKVVKETELAKRATDQAKALTVAVDPKVSKERRPEIEDASEVERAAAELPRALKKAAIEKKKAVTGQDKVGTAESRQREDARKWASGEVSDTAVVTQSTGEKVSTHKRGVKKTAKKKSIESVKVAQATYMQDFVASQYPPMDGGVSLTVRLGRAFVSGSLGRRTDDPRLFDAAVNITDCSVRLSTTKQKAKTPVTDPPPNLIDSEMDRGNTSDAHLSQSATDLDVQIELPSVAAECTFKDMAGPFDKAAIGEVPVAPGIVATLVEIGVFASAHATEDMTSGMSGCIDGSKTTPTSRSVVLAEYNQLLKEIEASTLAQEELRRTEPDLASAASFLDVVTRGAEEGRKLRKDNHSSVQPILIVTAEATSVQEVSPAEGRAKEVSQAEAKYKARQRIIRVTAAKSFLEEELAKVKPCLSSVAAFRKAAYGDESTATTSGAPGDIEREESAMVVESLLGLGSIPTRETAEDTGITPEAKEIVDSAVIVVGDREETVSDDDEMSVGDSESEGSEDFSGGSRSISDGKSIVSKNSRKRPADESPERDLARTNRKGFPGAVTRSDLPNAGKIATLSTPIAATTPDTAPSVAERETWTIPMDITEVGEMLGAVIETAKGSVGSIALTFIADTSISVGLEHTVGEPEAEGVKTAPCVALPGIVATGITTLDAPEANTTRTIHGSEAGPLDLAAEVMSGLEHADVAAELELPPTTDIATVQLGVTLAGEIPVSGGGDTDGTIESSAGAIGGENVVVRGIYLAGVGTLVATGACMPTAVIRPLAGEGWGKDAHMVEGIFRIVEGMEPLGLPSTCWKPRLYSSLLWTGKRCVWLY